jgi:hypothetical protein
VVKNLLGCEARLEGGGALLSDHNVFVAEPVSHVSQVFAVAITDFDAARGFYNEPRLIIIHCDMEHLKPPHYPCGGTEKGVLVSGNHKPTG